jgi:transposase
MEYAGTTDHIIFETWFEKALLASAPEGSTFVMDNASFHHKSALNELAQQVNCSVVFLPAYSPDYNPIEKAWANLKTFLRNHAYCFDNLQLAIADYFKG